MTAGLAGIDQRENMRMVEPGRDLDFGQKSLGTQHRAEFRREDFQCDEAIELEILGEIDGRHTTVA